jgi:hypothetical chaperone protein
MTAPNTLGIDFGTSNSAAGIAVAGRPFLIDVEPGETTLPTALFFGIDPKRMLIGRPASRALIDGAEGRFVRALKSLLGTPLLYEKRRLGGELVDFSLIISRFLAELKSRAETMCHQDFTHALSGRPVLFHSADPARNAKAEEDLRQCYLGAGFQDVKFLPEPEAAALSQGEMVPDGALGLIVDIGGGTSDYTIFEKHAGDLQIRSSHGLRLGGTDFDRQLSMDHVMPLLGKAAPIRNEFGPGTLPAPNAIFNDLATWQKIPFLYSRESLRLAKDLEKRAVDKAVLGRLVSVLEDETGHDIAFSVERGKIQTNREDTGRIALGMVQRGLGVELTHEMLDESLNSFVDQIAAQAVETCTAAALAPDQITDIVFVGGSSLLSALQYRIRARFPTARLHQGNAMTAVVDGLALASATAFA